MEGQEAAAMEGAGEDMMRQMMGEFGKMGEKEVRQARSGGERSRDKRNSMPRICSSPACLFAVRRERQR